MKLSTKDRLKLLEEAAHNRRERITRLENRMAQEENIRRRISNTDSKAMENIVNRICVLEAGPSRRRIRNRLARFLCRLAAKLSVPR